MAGALGEAERNTLQAALTWLYQNKIDFGTCFWTHMRSQGPGALNEEDEQIVMNEVTDSGKTRKLMDRIGGRGSDSFHRLCWTLDQNSQAHIPTYLRDLLKNHKPVDDEERKRLLLIQNREDLQNNL